MAPEPLCGLHLPVSMVYGAQHGEWLRKVMSCHSAIQEVGYKNPCTNSRG